MTQFEIKWITADDEEESYATELNSVRSAWTAAKKLAGKQFKTATVKVVD